MEFEIDLLVALIPPIVLLALIWKIDKLEREPWSLILKVFGLGVLSCLPAVILEIALDYPLASMFDHNYYSYIIASNFVGVALVEEGVKMAAMMIIVWRHKEFNCLFDGIVYGAASALGFAALENVKYVMYYGVQTGLVRAFTAIPGHMMFGIFMGTFVALAKCAKLDGKQSKKWVLLLLALAVPTLIHGYYDYLLSEGLPPFAEVLWTLYLGALFITAIVVVVVMAKKDRRIDINLGYSGESTLPGAVAAPGYVAPTAAYAVPGAVYAPVAAPAAPAAPVAPVATPVATPVAPAAPVIGAASGSYEAPKTELHL